MVMIYDSNTLPFPPSPPPLLNIGQVGAWGAGE